MPESPPLAATDGFWEGRDFSLVLGGPLYQFERRVRLADGAMGLVHRRVAFTILLLWGPLLALSAAEGGLVGPGLATPFVEDIGCHLRFLVATPLLVLSELVVHRRLQPLIDEFRLRGLVRPDQAPHLAAALRSAARWRNSVVAELLLLALVYVVGLLFTVHRYETLGGAGWYASPGEARLSWAGRWLVFVSLPLFQFLLLRWYFRLFIWARFLWQTARLDLDLNVTHPDRAGGLGFLADSLIAFVPLSMAHGVLFAGMMADRIFFRGAKLTDFQFEIFGGAVLVLVLFVAPLVVFWPTLAQVKRAGLRRYGALAQTYVTGFRDKWLRGTAPADEPLVGSGDIQSLADLGNSFATAEQMRFAPIRTSALLTFIGGFFAPILPLLLTMMPLETLLARMAGVLF